MSLPKDKRAIKFAAMRCSVFIAVVCLSHLSGCPGFGNECSRTTVVDEQGVMRWRDNGEEVALFGVNYYTPFWHNYPDLKLLGASHEKVIDHDVAHFARMGLDVLRLHVFDRELSDHDGNLLSNEHLRLLDYLIARAKQRGIYTVLTPIAWWPVPGDSPGFSTRFTMPQMITDPAARRAQTNYLAQFVRHVNRYTGLSYKEDPAVVCFELINEPQYSPGTSDAQIVDYINALADTVRGAGVRQPVFYNGWGGRLGAVRQARVDGSTFGWYPTGLVAGRSLRRNFLPQIDRYGGSDFWNPSMRTELLAHKAKIVYEFDAADVPGSHMYPAMARAFRGGGGQIATQFQYDPLPLAPFNQGWQTHYLNLVCAPQKAVSFVIAAEAFRRLPRLQDYGRYPASTRFGPFRVSYEEDLSEMVTETEFMYSGSTRTDPPSPQKLTRIVGNGSSSVVHYSGTGAYFLEKLARGAWRLEVYPDAVWVNDPYAPHRLDREVARLFWREWPMEVRLPDLGAEFSVEPLNDGNGLGGLARRGSFRVRPGVYLLKAASAAGTEWRSAKLCVAVGLTEYYAWPGKDRPWAVRHESPTGWLAAKALPLSFTVALAQEPTQVLLELRHGNASDFQSMPLRRENAYVYAGVVPADRLAPGRLEYRLMVRAEGGTERFPAKGSGGLTNAAWQLTVAARNAPAVLFDAEQHQANPQGQCPWKKSLVAGMSPGHRAVRVGVERFGPPPDSISFRNEISEELEPWREILSAKPTLCLRARALEPSTTAVEVVLIERDGSAWGANLPLKTSWSEARLPLQSLRHFAHWGGSPPGRGGAGDRIRASDIAGVNFCFGAWLYPNHAAEPHGIEFESLHLE